MSDNSTIEWTQATWNPITGCTEVSPGCDHCYAKTFAERFRGTPGHYFERGFDVQLRPDKLDQPLRWRRPRRIFVNSMSDLFHDSVPDAYIARVFAVMALAPQHTFQLLTKRHGRMRSVLDDDQFVRKVWNECDDIVAREHQAGFTDWPLPNVWLGVSAENQQWADIRIPALLDTPAAVRFVSAEPLLGPSDMSRFLRPNRCSQCSGDWSSPACGPTHAVLTVDRGLHLVIVGGESGRGARPMHPDWARGLRDQCQAAGVAFFLKQWGEYIPGPSANAEPVDLYVERESGRTATDDQFWHINGGHWWGVRRVGKKAAGRVLDGRTWDEFPEVVR